MIDVAFHSPTAPTAAIRPAFGRGLLALLAGVAARDARYREQRQLAELDPHILADIGLTRGEVRAAMRRSRIW